MKNEDNLRFKVEEFLDNGVFSLITIASRDVLADLESGSYGMKEDEDDIIVPDEYVMNLINDKSDDSLQNDMSSDPLGTIFETLGKRMVNVYVIISEEKDINLIDEYAKRYAPHLNLEYRVVTKEGLNSETIVNDINSIVPDVVMTYLDHAAAKEWFRKSRQLMNVALGVSIAKSAKGDTLRPAGNRGIMSKIRSVFGR